MSSNANTYQEYYKQYMQYMYSMSTAMYSTYNSGSASSGVYNNGSIGYPVNGQQRPPPPPPPPTPPSNVTDQTLAHATSPSVQQPNEQANRLNPNQNQSPDVSVTRAGVQQPPTIKINLKFQQQQQQAKKSQSLDNQQQSVAGVFDGADGQGPSKRRSRFDIAPTTKEACQTTVAKAPQIKVQIHQRQQPTVSPARPVPIATVPSSQTAVQHTAGDIVADINKWPFKLKNYCSKVYQTYATIKAITEQQVTNYLRSRITDVFKDHPDLNIDWDKEKIPDIIQIHRANGIQHDSLTTPRNTVKQLAQSQPVQQADQVPVQFNKTTKPTVAQQTRFHKKLRSRSRSRSSAETQSAKRSRSNSYRSSSTSSTSSSTRSSSSTKQHTKQQQQQQQQQKKACQPTVIMSKVKRADDFIKLNDDRMLVDEYEDHMTLKQHQINKNKAAKKGKKNGCSANISGILDNRFTRFYDQNLSTKRKNLRSLFHYEKEYESNAALDEPVFIGVSQDLEKEYLRLTGAPEASNVRPINVLKNSLAYVLEKYGQSKDYRYICDQLKAIRQDLTVQMIRNEFTIHVYETHARIAIMKGDREELNQCQAQLMALYSLNTGKQHENITEFIGYRLLYYILTKSYKDLNKVIQEIERSYKSDLYLKHLLSFCNAWQIGNYVKLFRLYKKSNRMSKFLIDLFIERERKIALKMIIKSYRPNIKLNIVTELLAYETIHKCREDLKSYGLVINTETNNIDCNSCDVADLVVDCKLSNLA